MYKRLGKILLADCSHAVVESFWYGNMDRFFIYKHNSSRWGVAYCTGISFALLCSKGSAYKAYCKAVQAYNRLKQLESEEGFIDLLYQEYQDQDQEYQN